MIRKVGLLLVITTGIVPLAVAMSSLFGLGLLRHASPVALLLAPMGVVLLPCLGLASLFHNRPRGLAFGLWVWPLVVLLGLPAYFPGERAEALSTGMGVAASVHGPETAETAATWGATVATWLGPEPEIARLPAEPIQADPEVVAPPRGPEEALQEDEVALPYEGEGRTLRIPVTFETRHGDLVETWMLFDTGATFTTLDEATLDALGVDVPPDAPEVTLHTANGERQARLVLLDKAWLGGFPVGGVTIAICEACSSAETGVAGLLGLNVSGQYTVTLDHDRQEMVLRPRETGSDRHLDIGPWLDIEATATAWPDGRVEVEVEAANRAPRDVTRAEVGIGCADDRFTATLSEVHSGDRRRTRVSLPRGTRCETYRVTLENAHW